MVEQRISVLLVEDDPFPQMLLAAYLDKEGIAVTVASTAEEMRAALRAPARPVDAIALDLGLPDEEGLVLVRQIRSRLDVPICIITRDDTPSSRTVAAELGANDYLVKPFHPRQLVDSLLGLLGRAPRAAAAVRFDGWSFDPAGRTVADAHGRPVPLTPSEFDILAALVSAAGRTVSRAQLLDAIASNSNDAPSRVVDVMLSTLRRKLGDPARNPRLIVTVPGVGYRFCAKLE